MKHLLAIGVLVLLVVATFRPAADFEYTNWDDDQYITHNGHVKAGLTRDSVVWALTSPHVGNWHPLTTLSLMADVQWFGLDPRAAHLENLILHAINTVLVYLVWLRMTREARGALWVAALFAVHPLHVESVAWISERKGLLCAMFWLLAMWLYAGYARRPSVGRYVILSMLIALALLSKPIAVVLPLALLIADRWPLARREPWPSLVLEKLPWLAMSLVLAVLTFVVQHQFGAVRSLEAVSLPLRVSNAAVSYLVYLQQTVWPTGLSCFYPFPFTAGDQNMAKYWLIARAVAAVAFLAGVSWLAIRTRRRLPYLFFGWFWYLVTLVPVIGLVQVGPQAHADRYTYLPLLGIFTMVAWGGRDLLMRLLPARPRVQGAIATVTLMIVVGGCWRLDQPAIAAWHDSESLFHQAIANTRPNAITHFNLGLYLDNTGRKDEALAEYRIALGLNPADARTQNNIAALLWQRGQIDEAFDRYRRAVTLDPNLAIARENLGEALLDFGASAEAAKHLAQAAALDPQSARAHYLLAKAESQLGRLDLAYAATTAALALDPRLLEARMLRALLLARLGDVVEAKAEFEELLRRDDLDATAKAWIREAMQAHGL